MVKTLKKVVIDRSNLWSDKPIYYKATANIILSGDELQIVFREIRNKTSTFTIAPVQYTTWNFS